MTLIADHRPSDNTVLHLVPRTPAGTVELPRRVDVHQIAGLVAQLTEQAAPTGHVIADAHRVEMIDLAALRAIDELAAEVSLRIVDASVALAVTADVTGHDRVVDACADSAPYLEAA